VDSNKKEVEVIDLLDSSSDEEDQEESTDIARIRNGNNNHSTNKRAVPTATATNYNKSTITKEQRNRNQMARSTPKRCNEQDLIDLFDSDSDSDSDSVHLHKKDRDGDNKIIAAKNDEDISNTKRNGSGIKDAKGNNSSKTINISTDDGNRNISNGDGNGHGNINDQKLNLNQNKQVPVQLEGTSIITTTTINITKSDGTTVLHTASQEEGEEHQQWVCPQCTVLNSNAKLNCNACHHRKPRTATPGKIYTSENTHRLVSSDDKKHDDATTVGEAEEGSEGPPFATFNPGECAEIDRSERKEEKMKKDRIIVKKKGKTITKKQRLSGYDTYSDDDTDDDDDDYFDPSEKKSNITDKKNDGLTLEGNGSTDDDDDRDDDDEFPHDSKTGKPHSSYMARPEFQLAEALVKKIYGQQENLRSILCDGIPIEDCHYDCSNPHNNNSNNNKNENNKNEAPVITSLSFTIDDLRGRSNRGGWELPDEIMEFGDTLEELSLAHCTKVPEDIAKRMKVLRTIRLYANTTESKNKRVRQRKVGGGRNTAINNNNNAMIPKNIVNFYADVDVDVDDDNNNVNENRDKTPLLRVPPKLILYGFKTIPRDLEKFARHVRLIGGSICRY